MDVTETLVTDRQTDSEQKEGARLTLAGSRPTPTGRDDVSVGAVVSFPKCIHTTRFYGGLLKAGGPGCDGIYRLGQPANG